MTTPSPSPQEKTPRQKKSPLDRRREKIAAEIQRNRRGEYTVPTWVLAALLVAVIAGIAALVIFA